MLPSLPFPHYHLGSDADYLPIHKQPASHELLYKTQTSRSQTLEEKDWPDFPTDCKSTHIYPATCSHCCFHGLRGAPGPRDASSQQMVMPIQSMVQLPACQPHPVSNDGSILSTASLAPDSSYWVNVQVLGPFIPRAESHSSCGFSQGNQVRNGFKSPSLAIVYSNFLPKRSTATHLPSITSLFFLSFLRVCVRFYLSRNDDNCCKARSQMCPHHPSFQYWEYKGFTPLPSVQ